MSYIYEMYQAGQDIDADAVDFDGLYVEIDGGFNVSYSGSVEVVSRYVEVPEVHCAKIVADMPLDTLQDALTLRTGKVYMVGVVKLVELMAESSISLEEVVREWVKQNPSEEV